MREWVNMIWTIYNGVYHVFHFCPLDFPIDLTILMLILLRQVVSPGKRRTYWIGSPTPRVFCASQPVEIMNNFWQSLVKSRTSSAACRWKRFCVSKCVVARCSSAAFLFNLSCKRIHQIGSECRKHLTSSNTFCVGPATARYLIGFQSSDDPDPESWVLLLSAPSEAARLAKGWSTTVPGEKTGRRLCGMVEVATGSIGHNRRCGNSTGGTPGRGAPGR